MYRAILKKYKIAQKYVSVGTGVYFFRNRRIKLLNFFTIHSNIDNII